MTKVSGILITLAYSLLFQASSSAVAAAALQTGSVPQAMYSYIADMSNAKPLDGAKLTGDTAYVQWSGDYSRAKYFCCKATDTGGEVIEAHGEAIEAPVMTLDLAALGESEQIRELYTDLYMADGSVQQGNFAHFAVAKEQAEPAPLPQVDPSAGPVAMYSYTADMSNAKPLDGAKLTGDIAYVQWSGDYSKAKYFCCKATETGGEVIEAHGEAIEAPVMTLDLAALGESEQIRELYTDLYMADGSVQQGNFAHFSVAEVAPEVAPEVQPAPLPQLDQVAGPVAMYSYAADMSNAKPLDGAELTGDIAYVQWSGDYSKAKYFCCKATETGGEVIEAHGEAIEAPVMTLDLAALGESEQIRELYTDLYMADGSVKQGNFAHFAVAEVVPEVAPEVQPAPLQQLDQVAGPVAMYSYAADMSNAKPLDGAELKGHTAYVQWSGDYSKAKYFCCKATETGGEVIEAHGEAIEAPVMTLDLAALGESEQIRELYTDLYMADGSVKQGNFAHFAVAEVAPEVVPQVASEVQPAPLPQLDQVAGPVAMYSYAADMSNAKPLDGAELKGHTAYVQWSGDYSKAKYFCCKATETGGEVIEAHGEAIVAPVMTLDLAALGESEQIRELYTDLYMADGSVQQGNFAHFAVAEVVPQVSPEVQPAPLPQLDQIAGPVAMYSYAADMSNAKPLDGAELKGHTVYVQWSGDYSKAKYFCCKATATGGEVIEAHGDAIEVSVMALDLTTLGESEQIRELYTDLYTADGKVLQNNQVYFTVAEVEPAPVPVKTEPKTTDITVEWTAPSERENGTYLSLGELSGYEIYYTTEISEQSAVIHIDGGHVNTLDIDALPADIYHFSVTAIDNDLLKSELSEIISMDLR